MNRAVREELIKSNPVHKLSHQDIPRREENRRCYLTEQEIQKLESISSNVKYNDIRNAFLFACFCGLRFSDVSTLKWGNVEQHGEEYIIMKRVQKTRSMLYLPLNQRAIRYLPPRTNDQDNVPSFALDWNGSSSRLTLLYGKVTSILVLIPANERSLAAKNLLGIVTFLSLSQSIKHP